MMTSDSRPALVRSTTVVPALSTSSPNPVTSKPSIVSAFINQPTFIQKGCLRFLILDAPHYDNINYYIEEFRNHGVTDLVRTCERTYDESVVMDAGIVPHALIFPDGDPPSTAIIREWLALVDEAARRNSAVGVHCLAGLGRAPVLVVIALIESGNMRNVEAIELVRSKRRGAINKRQLDYLMSYKKQRKLTPRACCGLL